MTTASRWTRNDSSAIFGPRRAAENHPVGDDRAGVNMMRRPPALQPWPWQAPEYQKSYAGGERRKVDQQQGRAAVRVCNQLIAPGQARHDHDRERNEADRAVDEDRIGRRAPAGAAARHQPQPHRVAADRGGQRLVEERADQVEAGRLHDAERRAAFGADDAPAQHADEDLQEGRRDRQRNPAHARHIEA